jgi:tRNA(Ile)-lysidine synthase
MIEKVLEGVAKHRMLQPGDLVVAAVSGGPDSIALLHALLKIAPAYDLGLVVAHLNHGLRGRESDEDERFVQELSLNLGLPFESAFVDIHRIKEERKGSLEDLAREERLRFLTAVAEKWQAQKVALGHHAQDQAETVLIQFLRGAGSEGLKGMLPIRDSLFIRPLLNISKDEIDAFLKEEGLSFRTDSSNASDLYLRNRVRRQLMPELKAFYNPNMEETLARLGEIMRLEDDYLKAVVREILRSWNIEAGRKETSIAIGGILSLHEALQKRIFKMLLEGLSPGGKGITYTHVQAVADLCRGGRTSGILHLPNGIRVKRTYDKIAFYPGGREAEVPVEPYAYDFSVPGELNLPETGETIRGDFVSKQAVDLRGTGGACLDFDRIVPPLIVRSFRPGDRFQPLGMSGSQKLKKFFIDHKIVAERRRSMPLVADRQSVIWIPGLRLADRVKITDGTRRVLRIEII